MRNVILLELYIRSRILLKYLKITEILSFLDKHDLSKCIKYCFDMALYFQNFPGGGGRQSQPRSDFFLDPPLEKATSRAHGYLMFNLKPMMKNDSSLTYYQAKLALKNNM